jgi:hypothetical protein
MLNLVRGYTVKSGYSLLQRTAQNAVVTLQAATILVLRIGWSGAVMCCRNSELLCVSFGEKDCFGEKRLAGSKTREMLCLLLQR